MTIEGRAAVGAIEQRILSGEASADEIREFQIGRDLEGLPGYGIYEKESRVTREWDCPGCGGEGIPCSIDCPQCGHKRDPRNSDPEQEGFMGEFREEAKVREPI